MFVLFALLVQWLRWLDADDDDDDGGGGDADPNIDDVDTLTLCLYDIMNGESAMR